MGEYQRLKTIKKITSHKKSRLTYPTSNIGSFNWTVIVSCLILLKCHIATYKHSIICS